MHSVTTVNLHRFGEGLLVEIVGEDRDGEVLVRSLELELVDRENGLVRPRSGLAAGEEPLLEEHLESAGYEIIAQPGARVA